MLYSLRCVASEKNGGALFANSFGFADGDSVHIARYIRTTFDGYKKQTDK